MCSYGELLSLEVQPCCNMYQHFNYFLLQNDVPLYGYTKLTYPFTRQWIFGLFPLSGYMKTEKLTRKGHATSPSYWASIYSRVEEGQSRKAIFQKQSLTSSEYWLVQEENAFDEIYLQKGKHGASVKKKKKKNWFFNAAGLTIELILCYTSFSNL